MKTVKIKAADPLPASCRQPEPCTIIIDGNVSDDTKKIKGGDLRQVKKYFDQSATILYFALVESLPQGVIEPLTIKLLQHRVSLYHGTMS